MEHAEPHEEVNVRKNESSSVKRANNRPPRGSSNRPTASDTMTDDVGVDEEMVDCPEVAADIDVDGEDDNSGSEADDIGGADDMSSAAVGQAEQVDFSATSNTPMPMDVDGDSGEPKAPSRSIGVEPAPLGRSQSGDLPAEDDDDDADFDDDDDSQPVGGAAGSEASPMESADGMESSNKDDESSVLSASDAGKSETASVDDADKDETFSISSERAALEDAYGPYIHPSDMCLDDARKRLRIAIEQTRILRESFTDQAYERFRLVMRPSPSSIDEIVDPIEADPTAAAANLREKTQARKVEKDKELRQSQQTGIALEELSYIGDGLDLVVLPDDEVSDSEIDVEQYPENGPTDQETSQRREGINTAAVTAVELLFDRIKRGRLIREGKDIETVLATARTFESTISESFHPTTFARAQTPSPAPSEDSNAVGVGQQRASKGLYTHLLTLNPEAEGDRANGGSTAVRSALVSRGVGMSETKRDTRINSVYQRFFQPNYLLPPSTDKSLPPLVGPQELSHLQAPDLLHVDTESATDFKIPLKTIVADFCDDIGSSSGMSEITLLRKVRDTFPKRKDSDLTGYEPLLLYSVMSAVGLIQDGDNARGSDVTSLGLVGLTELKPVADFLQQNLSVGKCKKRSLGQTILDLSDIDSAKRSKLEDEQEEPIMSIRGGEDGDEEKGEKSEPSSESRKNSRKGTVKRNDVPQSAAAPLLQYHLDANYKHFSAMAQSNSQSAMAAAAASTQLLQHQLGIDLQSDPYAAAVAASVPVGSEEGSLLASTLSEFYVRNGFGFTGASTGATLGLNPGPNAASRYEAAITVNPHNPFGYEPHPQLNAPIVSSKEQNSTKKASETQRKRVSSFSQNQSDKKINGRKAEDGEGIQIDRPASAPPSPHSPEINSEPRKTALDDDSDNADVLLPFTPPVPSANLPKKISNLALRARFKDAMTLATKTGDETEASLVDFLLSLGSAVPKLKSRIYDMLMKKLNLSDKRTHIGILVGDDKFASETKEMLVALIFTWICVEHRDVVDGMLSDENGISETHPELEWLTISAIEKSLGAIAPILNPLSAATRGDQMKQVVLVVGKSLTREVFVSGRQNDSLPIMDELMKLLDSLRCDALQAKTRERVLLAALVSRSSNMTEAFSNAYVSAIVRAGEALTHEDVCEVVQDTQVRASTMLPFDYFQDNAGVWEEPCRPEQGYHVGLCGVEMKREAHARSLLRKSMKRLQDQLGLRGGIFDGGPYYPRAPTITSAPTTPTGPSLMRTLSGSLGKQKGPNEFAPPDAAFNPGHFVPPMNWNINDVSNLPYGQYSLESMQFSSVGDVLSDDKKKEYSPINEDSSICLAQQYRSTHEVEWEDVADMFLHGGNTRQIDINSTLSADELTGKKKIFAPFVQPFDIRSLEAVVHGQKCNDDNDEEDISDETILMKHQEVLDEMKLKLDAALEKRRQQTQQRGRKKSVG